MSFGVMPSCEHLAQEQEVDRETAGNRDALAGQLLEMLVRRIGAHHDHGTGTVAERDDLDRNPLVRQVHYQRRQHVGGLEAASHQRFLHLGPAAVLAVFECELGSAARVGAVRGRLGDAGDRKRKVAGDR
jgi:hypothetical protein